LPNECCGLLAESADCAMRHFPLVNELHSPTAYRSEPRSMLNAMKAMRTDGTELVAIYHSHPTSDPIPSKRDLAENAYPGVVQLIVGLNGMRPIVRGWLLNETGYEEVSIHTPA
jgi:proteasome lid subunit RPN8/RPN11